MRETWWAAETGHCERPGEAIDWRCSLRGRWSPYPEGVVREVKGWHHVAGSEALKRAQQRLLGRPYPQQQGRPHVLEIPKLGATTKVSTRCETAQAHRTSYMCCRFQSQRSIAVKAPWSSEYHKWVPDAKHWMSHIFGFWFCLDMILTVPWLSFLN